MMALTISKEDSTKEKLLSDTSAGGTMESGWYWEYFSHKEAQVSVLKSVKESTEQAVRTAPLKSP